jgi:hypothetical protein
MGVVHKILSGTILQWATRFFATALFLPNIANQKQKMLILPKNRTAVQVENSFQCVASQQVTGSL